MSRFHFLGFVRSDRQLYNNFDVFVSSSRSRKDFPCPSSRRWRPRSRPIVATRSGGAEQAIVDRASGLLVPVDAPEALAAALIALVTDDDLRSRLALGARARCMAEFESGAHVYRAYEALFTSGSRREYSKQACEK